MHAVVVSAPGSPDVLGWSEVPDPEAKPGEVVLDVAASAVNRTTSPVATEVELAETASVGGKLPDNGSRLMTTSTASGVVPTLRIGVM